MSFNDGNLYEMNQYQPREILSSLHNTNFPNQGNRNENNDFFPAYYQPYVNDISADNNANEGRKGSISLQPNLQGLNPNDNLFAPNRDRIPSVYQYQHKGSFELPDIYRPIPNQFPDGSIFPSFYPNPYGNQGMPFSNYFEDPSQIAESGYYQRERKYSQPYAQIQTNEQYFQPTRNMVFLPYPSTYQNPKPNESMEIPQARNPEEKTDIMKINKTTYSQNINLNNPNKVIYHENFQQIATKNQSEVQQMGPIEQLPNILGQQNNIIFPKKEEIHKEIARKSINKKSAADKRIRIKGRFVTTKQAFVYMGVSPFELASNPIMGDILKKKLDYSIFTTCKNGIKIRNLQTLIKKALSKSDHNEKALNIIVRIKSEDDINKQIEIEIDRPSEITSNNNLSQAFKEDNKTRKYKISLVENPIFECKRINVHEAPMDHLDYHKNMKEHK